MPTLQDIIKSIKNPQENYQERQKLIKEIEKITDRRLLVYVSDVNKPGSALLLDDKEGFSDLIQDIEEENVDILVNSPGGLAEVTETIVGMLRYKFKSIRFAVPNMAKSAATLLTFSGDQILMDHRSELGPIDPQIKYKDRRDRDRYEAVEDIIEGVERVREVLEKKGPEALPVYVPLLENYSMGLIRGCERAKELSFTLAKNWLENYMFVKEDTPSDKIKKILELFAERKGSLSHLRPIGVDKCLNLGLNVLDLRKDEHKTLREKLWALWCLFALHFERTSVHKIYENSSGCSLSKQSAQILLVPPKGVPPKKES